MDWRMEAGENSRGWWKEKEGETEVRGSEMK